MEKKSRSSDELGLVISDKNGRPKLFEPNFVTADELSLSQHALEMALGLVLPDEIAQSDKNLRTRSELDSEAPERRKAHNKSRSYDYRLELSPGSIRVARADPNQYQLSPNYKEKTAIYEWSKKSRSSMVARLCTLDYSEMFTDSSRPPAMITLTYPGKSWIAVIPSGSAAKRHLTLFRKRYERTYGVPLVAIWKMEFTRKPNQACHFHLFFAPPEVPHFATWLSKTWCDIVNHPDPQERAKHLRAGTGIDYSKSFKSFDPKRISTYFSKHGSANYGVKEYQNQAPEAWIVAGDVGRFWGYWNLHPLVKTIELSEADALFMARTLRRWGRANGKPRKKTYQKIDTTTGEIRIVKTTERVHFMKNRLGFASLNDGSAMANQLARAIVACRR